MARRYASLIVSAQLLEEWLKRGPHPAIPVENQLPPDARIVGASFGVAGGGEVTLTFESDSFDTLGENQTPPVLPAIVFEAT